MWNDEITLIDYPIIKNKHGQEIEDKENANKQTILAIVRSATRAEFYNYGSDERQPNYVVTVNKCEYENQSVCHFRGRRFFISRVYEVDEDFIELTLSVRKGT